MNLNFVDPSYSVRHGERDIWVGFFPDGSLNSPTTNVTIVRRRLNSIPTKTMTEVWETQWANAKTFLVSLLNEGYVGLTDSHLTWLGIEKSDVYRSKSREFEINVSNSQYGAVAKAYMPGNSTPVLTCSGLSMLEAVGKLTLRLCDNYSDGFLIKSVALGY